MSIMDRILRLGSDLADVLRLVLSSDLADVLRLVLSHQSADWSLNLADWSLNLVAKLHALLYR